MFLPFAFLVGITFHWRPRILPYFVVVHILLNLATVFSLLSVAYSAIIIHWRIDEIPGYYAILVGVLMLAQWTFFLATGQVPELQSESWRITLHLAAEFTTAAGLIVAGLGVLRRASWASKAYLFFTGMLAYSVIVDPGYFAQQGQWVLVIMFVVLFILVIIAALNVAKSLSGQA